MESEKYAKAVALRKLEQQAAASETAPPEHSSTLAPVKQPAEIPLAGSAATDAAGGPSAYKDEIFSTFGAGEGTFGAPATKGKE